MAGVTAATATVEIIADDDMVIGGSILAGYCSEQEAPLRATALALIAEEPVCIVSLDVLALGREHADRAAETIAAELGVPLSNILITSTHTHHAPTTMTVHGYEADQAFCNRAADAAIAAAKEAFGEIAEAKERPNDCDGELLFALGIEGTVGHNSRWVMDDGQVTWCGHDPSLAVRPTGPHDPALPVLAVRRRKENLAGALFCHATHNIGTLTGNVRSPATFGLAAQELERRHGAPFLFAPGAFGSSHRVDGMASEEAVGRIVAAVEEALGRLEPVLNGPVAGLKRPFTCTRRTWDETEEDAAVRRWCERWFPEETATAYVEVFAKMREGMAAEAGGTFETWLQVMRLGDVAIVGVPGEMFGSLGLEIRRRSPFRHTVVIGLANDEVGYIPDRQGYVDGGYQMWVGLHSQLAPGTGERMVEEALGMLRELHEGPLPDEPTLDKLRADDTEALQRFYNGLGAEARRLFCPLGWCASFPDCGAACREAEEGKRLDYVLRHGRRIVGWAFLVGWEGEVPHFGIGIAEGYCGRGYGKLLTNRVIDDARAAGKQAIELIHVKTNTVAGGLYRSVGFKETGEHKGQDGYKYWEMRLEL